MRADDVETGKPTAARGRPKRRSDEQTRAVIVSVAEREFGKHGYAATKTETIAALAHISKQTIYRHFATKAELFSAVVSAHRRQMLSLTDAGDELPLEEALAKIFRADLTPAQERRRKALLRVVLREAPAHPELQTALMQDGLNQSQAELAAWLAACAARGAFPPGDYARYAGLLMDIAFGADRDSLFCDGRRPKRRDRGAELRWRISVFLRGVAGG